MIYTRFVFPRIPDKWGADERRFASGLRDLFESLFAKKADKMTDSLTKALQDQAHPVGSIVLSAEEECPVTYGEWTEVTTGLTGIYAWRRDT